MKKKILLGILLLGSLTLFHFDLKAQTYESWMMETAQCPHGGTYDRCWNVCTVEEFPDDPTGCICAVSEQTVCSSGGY